jgi:carbon-monoxide dehydrogenase medium subunit
MASRNIVETLRLARSMFAQAVILVGIPIIGGGHARIGMSDCGERPAFFDLQLGPSHTSLAAERVDTCRPQILPASTMKPAPFRYIAATSLAQALALKAEHGDEAKFLAGGQSLMPTMNFRLARPAVLIDINGLFELAGVRPGANATRIGALTRYRVLERDPTIAAKFPLISEALPEIAHPQIRNRGTLGGNLCHADPASEMPAIMVALSARLRIQSATGERWIAAPAFFQGGLTTDLADEEMLVEIELPALPPRTGCCFIEIARRRGDFAIVGVAAMVTLGDDGQCVSARLVFCGVGDIPVDAQVAAQSLAGRNITDEAIRGVAAAARNMIDPPGSVHATADYQRHVAGVLTERALATAQARARHGH